MATTISTQDIVDAKRDIDDIGKAVNEKVIVSPRYGEDFKSLPMIAAEAQGAIGEWEAAISLITQEGGVPALAVSDASGVTQQNINDLTGAPYRVRVGGYNIGDRVVLESGDIVKSAVEGNTADPNLDMTGWENFEADQKELNDRLFSSIELTSSQFGITGVGDETAKLATMVAFVNANYWISKVVIDSDITSSQLMTFTRGVEIDFKGRKFNCTFEGAKFTAGVFFKGVVDTGTYATLTVDNAPLSNKFTVNNASIFAVGDYVSATYRRSIVASATYASEDIVFTAKILSISGNDLYLDHSHGFGVPIVQPWGTAAGSLPGTQLDICKSYPIFNPKVKGFNFSNGIESTTTRLNAATFYICIDAELSDVTATGIGGQMLHNIGCRGTKTKNLSTVNPRSVAGGRGYVIQENGSHDSDHDNLTGINDRHTHDISTMSSRVKVRNSRGVGSANYSFGCHSSCIYDVTIENCDGSGGFHYGNSNIGNPTDGYFGSATGEITLKNVASSGTLAKIYLSPLVSTGLNRIENCKIPNTGEAYGVRISANTIVKDSDFNTRVRVNKHQAYAKATILNNTNLTVLEGGSTDTVGKPDITLVGGSITTAQAIGKLILVGGASIINSTSSNLLGVDYFSIEGGSINITGASDLTFNADAHIGVTTTVFVGRVIRLIGGNIDIRSTKCDATLDFFTANPMKLTIVGAYVRTINMAGGGSNCKMIITGSEINSISPITGFNYLLMTGNKVNGGTMPVASARYIVDNNLIG